MEKKKSKEIISNDPKATIKNTHQKVLVKRKS